jgi:hypothetical protein
MEMGQTSARQNPTRRGGFPPRGAPLWVSLALIAACATPGPPEMYRFPSNHTPDEAMRCVSNRLRLEGFDLLPRADSTSAVAADSTATPTAANGSAIALRSVATEEVGGREWWRLELSVSLDVEGGTVVHSVAGSADREEGPYQAPSIGLQGLWGKLTASCTWGSDRSPPRGRV